MESPGMDQVPFKPKKEDLPSLQFIQVQPNGLTLKRVATIDQSMC